MSIRFNISLEEKQEAIDPVEPNNELDYADKDEIDFTEKYSKIKEYKDVINQGMDLAEGMESLAYIASKIENPTPIHIALFRTAANMAVAGSNYSAEAFLPAMESNKPIALEGFVEKTKELNEKILLLTKNKNNSIRVSSEGIIDSIKKLFSKKEEHESKEGKEIENIENKIKDKDPNFNSNKEFTNDDRVVGYFTIKNNFDPVQSLVIINKFMSDYNHTFISNIEKNIHVLIEIMDNLGKAEDPNNFKNYKKPDFGIKNLCPDMTLVKYKGPKSDVDHLLNYYENKNLPPSMLVSGWAVKDTISDKEYSYVIFNTRVVAQTFPEVNGPENAPSISYGEIAKCISLIKEIDKAQDDIFNYYNTKIYGDSGLMAKLEKAENDLRAKIKDKSSSVSKVTKETFNNDPAWTLVTEGYDIITASYLASLEGVSFIAFKTKQATLEYLSHCI